MEKTNNSIYEYYRIQHPEWSEDQIWLAVSLALESEKKVDGGEDVDIKDPDIIRSILEGARNWLKEVLPNVFQKVATFFEQMISSIGEWVQKGLAYAIDAIEYIYEKGKQVVDALKTPVN